jgi:hypothetical protein
MRYAKIVLVIIINHIFNYLAVLLPFMKYVDRLDYDEKPDYGYLRHILLKILLDKDLIPDSTYDWDI